MDAHAGFWVTVAAMEVVHGAGSLPVRFDVRRFCAGKQLS